MVSTRRSKYTKAEPSKTAIVDLSAGTDVIVYGSPSAGRTENRRKGLGDRANHAVDSTKKPATNTQGFVKVRSDPPGVIDLVDSSDEEDMADIQVVKADRNPHSPVRNTASVSRRGRKRPFVAAAAAAASAMPIELDSEEDEDNHLGKLRQVLEMFPTAPRFRIRKLLRIFNGDVGSVVASLLTSSSGPEADSEIVEVWNEVEDRKPAALWKQPEVPMASVTAGPVTTLHRQGRRKRWTYDFMVATDQESPGKEGAQRKEPATAKSDTNTFCPNNEYLEQAQAQLCREFCFLSMAGAKSILHHGGRKHFAIAHQAIVEAIKKSSDHAKVAGGKPQESDEDDSLTKEYGLVERAMSSSHALDESQIANLAKLASIHSGRIYLKHPRAEKPPWAKRSVLLDFADATNNPTVTNKILDEEIVYVHQKMNDWMIRTRNHIKRKQNQVKAQMTNTGVECMCCFDQFLMEDMCACRNEGHLFCVDCLANFADTQIFGLGNLGAVDPKTKRPAMDLKCFYADCSSGFSREILEKALSPTTMEKYDELQFQITVQAADLNNLVACPRCGFQVQVDQDAPDGSEHGQKFVCPMDDCKHTSCRSCFLPWHEGKTCDQVRQEAHSQTGRHCVEEAMTLAKVRACPKCKKPFLKESGCNKITCTGCGTLSCYVCRKVIPPSEGYRHFCQEPHCKHDTCGKCQLWTKNDDKVDETAMREAGLQAAATVDEAAAVVDELIDGKKPAKKTKRHKKSASPAKHPRRGGRRTARVQS